MMHMDSSGWTGSGRKEMAMAVGVQVTYHPAANVT
jgi:hypothetical protein